MKQIKRPEDITLDDLRGEPDTLKPCISCATPCAGFHLPGDLINTGKNIKYLCDACLLPDALAKYVADYTIERQKKINALSNASGMVGCQKEHYFRTFVPQNDYDATVVRTLLDKYDFTKNVIFCGPAGCGKTHLAASICNHMIENFMQPVRFGHLYALLAEFRSCQKMDGLTECEAYRRNFIRPAILTIDDADHRMLTPAEMSVTHCAISERHTLNLATVVTANCSIADLETQLGEPILSRLLGRAQAFDGKPFAVMASVDYRQRHL